MSLITADYLKMMRNSNGIYPECILTWLQNHKHAECISKMPFKFPFFQNSSSTNTETLWFPDKRIALIISMMDYKPGSHLSALDNTDGVAMTQFLSQAGFSVTSLQDSTFEQVENAITNMRVMLKQTSKQEKICVFIYYSGQGFLCDGLIEGAGLFGEPIPIESNIRMFSTFPNTLVLALLDCSREPKIK